MQNKAEKDLVDCDCTKSMRMVKLRWYWTKLKRQLKLELYESLYITPGWRKTQVESSRRLNLVQLNVEKH